MKSFKIGINKNSSINSTNMSMNLISSSNVFKLFLSESSNGVNMNTFEIELIEKVLFNKINIESMVLECEVSHDWNECLNNVVD